MAEQENEHVKNPWYKEPLFILFGVLNVVLAALLTMQFSLFEKVQKSELAAIENVAKLERYKRHVAETYITRDDVKTQLNEIKDQINKLIDLAIKDHRQ